MSGASEASRVCSLNWSRLIRREPSAGSRVSRKRAMCSARFRRTKARYQPKPCQRKHTADHGQQKSQPPAGIEMENNIEDERQEDDRANIFHAAQQELAARFFLVLAVRGGQPVQDGLRFVQHNPHRLRKNQSSSEQ